MTKRRDGRSKVHTFIVSYTGKPKRLKKNEYAWAGPGRGEYGWKDGVGIVHVGAGNGHLTKRSGPGYDMVGYTNVRAKSASEAKQKAAVNGIRGRETGHYNIKVKLSKKRGKK